MLKDTNTKDLALFSRSILASTTPPPEGFSARKRSGQRPTRTIVLGAPLTAKADAEDGPTPPASQKGGGT